MTADATDPTVLADVPAARLFQLDGAGTGELRNCVNLFRGAVSLPLQLVSLRGRGGLDVDVTISYGSDIEPFAGTWNATAPTSILGLGWSLPADMVMRSAPDPAAPGECTFYLLHSGDAEELICTGQDDAGRLTYILRNYQFWRLTQDTQAQTWELVTEDGTVSVYGGLPPESAANGIEWGVAWANWAGPGSSSLGAQQRIPLSWRLTSITSPAGDTVTYSYDTVEEQVGTGGLNYTKACYLSRITDPGGRVVDFGYAEKLHGAAGPGGATVYEYRDPHKSPQLDFPDNDPGAYQDRYETRYLDTVSVSSDSGQLLWLLRFGYDLRVFTSSGESPEYQWKRCLTSLRQYNSRGESLPGIQLDYYGQGDLVPGALSTLTYPYGGANTFHYTEQPLPTDRQLTVQGPGGATPRVWHGPDYVVVAWYGTGGGIAPLLVTAYSWMGSWVEQVLIDESDDLDLATLNVIAAGDFVGVLYRAAGPGDSLQLFRRDITEAGHWVQSYRGAFAVNEGALATTAAAGDEFVVLANTGYQAGPVQAIAWDYRQASWLPVMVPDLPTGALAVSARSGFYVACGYDTTAQQATFAIVSRDASGTWTSSTWTDAFTFDTAAPSLNLALGPTYLVVTVITAMDSQTLTSQSRTYLWDDALHPLDSGQPFVQTHTTPLVNGVPQSSVGFAELAGSLVGNGPDLARYGGGITGPGFDPSPYWPAAAFAAPDPAATCQYAYGDDVVVACVTDGGQVTSTMLTFDPNQPPSSGWADPVLLSPGGADPTIAGDYLTAGAVLYIRQPGQGWVQVPVDLPGEVDTASIQNRAPGYLAYQDTGGDAAQTYAVLLGDGGATVLGALPGGPQKIAADGPPRTGTQLAGASAFVTYPASGSFDTADILTLYRVVAGDVTGPVVDHPVDHITTDDGYGDTTVQGYLYDATTTTFDAVSGVAQYTKVTTVPGVADPVNDPARPFGRTDNYFSNATLQQTDPFYPPGTQYNYDGLLNGVQLCQQDFDDTGTLVASTVNYWQPFQADPVDPTRLLPGAYFRREKTVTAQDGMEPKTTEYSYDADTGLQTGVTSIIYDSTGAARTLVRTTTYGYQVPAYQSGLLALHQLSPVAQQTTTADAVPTASKVTTWRDWASGGRPRWAAEDTYQWRGTGTGPVFDFGGAASADWLLLQRVVSRSPAGNQPTEVLDARGTPKSILLDQSGNYPVAQFYNASLSGGEMAWADFEAYSVPAGWTPGAAATVDDGDGHTGTSSLRLDPAAAPGLTATLTPGRQAFDYLLLAWVKTAPGFGTDPGQAEWTVTLTRSGQPVTTPVVVPVTDTGGVWAPVTIPVGVRAASQDGAAPVTLGISLHNGKTTAALWADDARVAPLACNAAARVYDATTRMVTATLSANAGATRIGLDSFLRQNLVTSPAGEVSSLSSAYYSRDGNAGAFTAGDPNLELGIGARSGGGYDAFSTGDEWRTRWRPDSTAWQVAGGKLMYAGSGPSVLTAIADADYTDYAVRIRLRPAAIPSGNLAVRVGSRLELSWQPADGSWRLSDGGTEQMSSPGTLFSVPLAPYQQPLNDAVVPVGLREVFTGYGCALTDPQVTVIAQGQSWVITDLGTGTSYYLNTAGDQITVTRPPSELLLVVGAAAVLCYGDGRRLFSYQPQQPVSGAPALAVAAPVTVDDLVLAVAPHVIAAYQDATGNTRQAQELLGAQSLTRQTVYDPLGRPVVQTKTAAVSPAGPYPLLAYRPDFVTALDWTSGVMTGLVADAYPDDGGYPYERDRYEATPNARVAEHGEAGALLAIDLTKTGRHTTSFSYTTNDGTSDGLPAGQYHVRVTTDPDGAVTSELADRLGRGIRTQAGDGADPAVQAFVEHDLYGNAITLLLPNHYNPPPGSIAEDWVVSSQFDFFGRLAARTAPSLGSTSCIYSPAGDLRFSQESAAAANGVYLYWTYDQLGRVIEAGELAGTWDPVQLQSIADSDPAWPPSPPTWRKRISYDGDGTSPYPIGQPAQIQVSLGDDGIAETTEVLTYDVSGSVVRVDTSVPGYDGAVHSLAVTHDNQGRMTSISAPSEPGFAPVTYRYDQIGRTAAIGTDTDPVRYATYSYNANSTLATEILAPGAATPITRTFSYAPPVWPTGIACAFGGGSLDIDVDYTAGGIGGSGSYTGQVSRLGIRRSWPQAPGDLDTQLQYDPETGYLAAAQTDGEPAWSIGSPQYDANGNIRAVTVGGTEWTYSYGASDRLLGVTGPAVGPVTLGYDASGFVTSASQPGRSTTFTIDPSLHRVRSAQVQAAADTTVQFSYTGQDDRLLKQVTAQGATTSMLYLSGLAPYPVIERTRDGTGAETVVRNVTGVGGLIAVEPAGGEPLFLLTDHQRSTRAVVTAAGEVVSWYDYLPYGGLAQSGGQAPVPVRYLYTGQEYDAELDIYNYRARFYDPGIGRFYAPDEEGQSASPYIYAGNDPLSNVDPSGGVFWLVILGIIAQAVLDVALEVATDGAATPLVVAEADTDAGLLAADAVATETSSIVESSAVRAVSAATKEEGEADAEATQLTTGLKAVKTVKTETEAEPLPRVITDSSFKPPSGYKLIGKHYTSTVFDDIFEKYGIVIRANAGKNFGGQSQLGEGFYLTMDDETGQYFGEIAVRNNGGTLRKWEVYVKDLEKLRGSRVPKKLQWGQLPWKGDPLRDKYITKYDYLFGRISGLGNKMQTKVNPRLVDRLVLVRRYSTWANRAKYYKIPATPKFGVGGVKFIKIIL